MNKCFFLNPEKNLVQICLVVSEKNAKNANFNSEKCQHRAESYIDYSNNQLNC